MSAFDTAEVYLTRGGAYFEGRYNIGFWPWELPRFPTLLGAGDGARFGNLGSYKVSAIGVHQHMPGSSDTNASSSFRHFRPEYAVLASGSSDLSIHLTLGRIYLARIRLPQYVHSGGHSRGATAA